MAGRDPGNFKRAAAKSIGETVRASEGGAEQEQAAGRGGAGGGGTVGVRRRRGGDEQRDDVNFMHMAPPPASSPAAMPKMRLLLCEQIRGAGLVREPVVHRSGRLHHQ